MKKIEISTEEYWSLKTDAERYRFLRRQPNDCKAPRIDICYWTKCDDSVNEGEGLRGEEADALIDKMIAEEAM